MDTPATKVERSLPPEPSGPMVHLGSWFSTDVWVRPPQRVRRSADARTDRVLHLDAVTVAGLWEAVLRARERVKDGKSLCHVVAEELASELRGSVPLERLEDDRGYRLRVARIEDVRCPGAAGECLMALVAEALTRRETGAATERMQCIWRNDGTCSLTLVRAHPRSPGAPVTPGP